MPAGLQKTDQDQDLGSAAKQEDIADLQGAGIGARCEAHATASARSSHLRRFPRSPVYISVLALAWALRGSGVLTGCLEMSQPRQVRGVQHRGLRAA